MQGLVKKNKVKNVIIPAVLGLNNKNNTNN